MNREHHTPLIAPSFADRTLFDRWAQVYDSQVNPLLALEERHIMPLLPAIDGREVLDFGCGTGRWLRKLEGLRPSTLIGLDCSAAMLDSARDKIDKSTRLLRSDCSEMPGEDKSAILVLASFVLSYLDDLAAFVVECSRVVCPGGWVLISDMHPLTALERDWKRSFTTGGEKVEVAIRQRPLDEIVDIFRAHDFDVSSLLEEAFELPERPLFQLAGKLSEFEELAGVPAIYILKLRKRTVRDSAANPITGRKISLICQHIASGPTTWCGGSIEIVDAGVMAITKSHYESAHALDLSGYSVLPGLINAHDHLEFGLYPMLGRSVDCAPYRNSAEWAEEIHSVHAATIERYESIPMRVRLWWGALRNLLCGVTTVCHHNPLHSLFDLEDFPVGVVSRFGWSHSLSFGSRVVEAFTETPRDCPFILHAAEGLDDASRNEIVRLDQMGLLDSRTVIVHGLALSSETTSLVNRRGASVVTCPTSNAFLFGRTLTRTQLESIERSALGSDSPITSPGDLLDEVHYLHSRLGLNTDAIYSMVTTSPVEILRLKSGIGTIAAGGMADLIAVRGQGDTPAQLLSQAGFEQVELAIVSGRVRLASQAIYERLPQQLRSGMEPLSVAGHRRWLRAPIRELCEVAESVLGKGNLSIGGRRINYARAL